MRAILVHNPDAGDGSHECETLLERLGRFGDDVTLVPPQPDALREALSDLSPDLLIAGGGDGTVAAIVRAIGGHRDVPLLVLPLGTANNVAESLGIDKPQLDLRVVRERWIRKPIDVAIVDDAAIAIESAGCGAIAEFMHAASGDDRDGVKREAKSLAGSIANFRPFRYRMSVDGEEIEGEALAIEAMIFGQMGPRVVLAPGADPSDGLLDLAIVDESSRAAFAHYLRSPRRRKPPALPTRRARSATIACEATWHIDGEIAAPPRTISIRRAGWTAMVPAR